MCPIERAVARPKPTTRIRLSALTKTLLGLKSWWTSPASWAACRPRPARRNTSTTSVGERSASSNHRLSAQRRQHRAPRVEVLRGGNQQTEDLSNASLGDAHCDEDGLHRRALALDGNVQAVEDQVGDVLANGTVEPPQDLVCRFLNPARDAGVTGLGPERFFAHLGDLSRREPRRPKSSAEFTNAIAEAFRVRQPGRDQGPRAALDDVDLDGAEGRGHALRSGARAVASAACCSLVSLCTEKLDRVPFRHRVECRLQAPHDGPLCQGSCRMNRATA